MTDAVMITNIAVDGKSVDCGLFVRPDLVQPVAPFQADEDWLRKTTITLINRTFKTIAAAVLVLQFLDTGDCRAQPCAAAHILLGKIPAVDAYDGRTGQPLKPEHPERPPLDWKPGQTLTVRLGDYMDGVEAESGLSNHMPVTAVTKVAIHLGAFFFDDGMRWRGDGYSVPSSERPGKYERLPRDYFPGKRGQNWPPGYEQ